MSLQVTYVKSVNNLWREDPELWKSECILLACSRGESMTIAQPDPPMLFPLKLFWGILMEVDL